MKKFIYIILCTLVTTVACSTNNIGRKVYVEKMKEKTRYYPRRNYLRIHIDKNCPNLKSDAIVEFVDTAALTNSIYYRYCPKCVSDNDADKLDEIIKGSIVPDTIG